MLVALAYPDRVARRRVGAGPAAGAGTVRYRLRNGRGAALDAAQPLAHGHEFLAVAELAGAAGDATSRIALAAPLAATALTELFGDQIERVDEVTWDADADGVRARRVDRLGALVLRASPLADPDPARVAGALAAHVADRIRARGIDAALPWRDAARALRQRVTFVRTLDGQGDAGWPDWSDEALATTIDAWLLPALAGLRRWAEVGALDLAAVLGASLSWSQRGALDVLAPTHLTVPTGSRIRVDYADPGAPTVAVRLQELFGVADTPRVGGGAVALTLQLLSPAQRPVQVTRDLGGFWRSSYQDVRKDLRGRYPRHPWPDDPLRAEPTRRAKPRGS